MKIVSGLLFVLLVSLNTYLLLAAKLTGTQFVVGLLLSIIAVAVIHNLEAVQQFGVKGAGMEATLQLQRIREDVYAKADEVRHLAEQFAEMLADNVAHANRLVGEVEDLHVKLLRHRAVLRNTLTNIGTSAEERERIVCEITKMVAFDLRHEIAHATVED